MSRALFACILLTTISGCGAEGACAIDSDCPIRFRCTANVCTGLAPSLIDSGAPPGDAGADTGASLDAFAVDASSVDVGPLPDVNSDAGPRPDAFTPNDAFADACPALVSDYSVSSFSRGCFAVGAMRVMFMRTGPSCSYSLTSDDDISGDIMLTGGAFVGPMSIGTRSYPACTVTPRAGGQLTLGCGTCTVALLPLL